MLSTSFVEIHNLIHIQMILNFATDSPHRSSPLGTVVMRLTRTILNGWNEKITGSIPVVVGHLHFLNLYRVLTGNRAIDAYIHRFFFLSLDQSFLYPSSFGLYFCFAPDMATR